MSNTGCACNQLEVSRANLPSLYQGILHVVVIMMKSNLGKEAADDLILI